MSDQPQGPRATRPPESEGGGGWKWLVGLVLVALIAGGGYLAWKNFAPSQPSSEVASNAAPSTEPTAAPIQTEPLPSDQATQSETTSAETSAPAPEVQTAANTPTHAPSTHHRAAHAAPQPVPLQVIGVTPASVTTDNSDTIIIPGHRPVWTRAPSAYRLSDLYPERALEGGREGEATVHCTIGNSGALHCAQLSETPANSGFGSAALRISRLFRHAPQLSDGSQAAGTPIDLRVVFRMADDPHRHS
ncbi:MAG: TonB family protein [Pseudomonadota bacterium]